MPTSVLADADLRNRQPADPGHPPIVGCRLHRTPVPGRDDAGFTGRMNHASDPVVDVVDLRKSYGTTRAVDGIGFEIRAGEIFALLGPNGAGKSTTIEILEGFRTVSSGHVRVLGADPATADATWRARVGVVGQSTADIERFSARELLRHFAGFYPHPRDPDEVLEAVGLAEHAGARVRALSGGQKRRVDVALGIIGRPELLFLDEPTTGFDPAARRQFWTLIETLRAEGTTILLTTHYLDEAERLADRVGVIDRGRLIEIGTMSELGGPEARTPLVSWLDDDGRPRSERTHEPAALVVELVAASGGEPAGLSIHRPTLEDVYLDLLEASAHAAEPSASGAATDGPSIVDPPDDGSGDGGRHATTTGRRSAR